VKISISNGGSSSTGNMIFEIVPNYPFEAVSGEDYTQSVALNSFQSGSDAKILTYKLKINKDATQGTYYLTIKYYLEGSENSSVSQTVGVSVGNSQSVEIIHIDKTVLIPGQQSGMKFVINNVGGSTLRNMKFYWKNDNNIILPVGSDNTQYIKYLDVGGNVELNYQVIADTSATAGLYPLNLYLSYTDPATNNVTTVNTIAGVYVGGSTDFDVAYSDSSTGTTSFTVANIGSNPATSVSVSIPEQRSWRVTGSNSVIIGNLNKGDYTVASFKLASMAAASGAGNRTGGRNMTYPNSPSAPAAVDSSTNIGPDSVLMQIAYTDTMGIRTIVNKTIKIGVQNLNSSSTSFGARGAATKPAASNTIYYIIGAIVLVAGFIFYRRYQKQKLLKADSTIKDVFKAKKK